MSKPLEVGHVYRLERPKRFYLAIGKNRVVTMRGGQLRETKSSTKLNRFEMSVAVLCSAWDCDKSILDEISERFFKPTPQGRVLACQPKGPRVATPSPALIHRLELAEPGFKKRA